MIEFALFSFIWMLMGMVYIFFFDKDFISRFEHFITKDMLDDNYIQYFLALSFHAMIVLGPMFLAYSAISLAYFLITSDIEE